MKIAGHQSRLYCKWDDVDALFYFGKFVVAACNKASKSSAKTKSDCNSAMALPFKTLNSTTLTAKSAKNNKEKFLRDNNFSTARCSDSTSEKRSPSLARNCVLHFTKLLIYRVHVCDGVLPTDEFDSNVFSRGDYNHISSVYHKIRSIVRTKSVCHKTSSENAYQ